MSQEKKATIKENTEKAKSSDSKKNKKNTPIQDEKLPLKTDIDTTTKEDDKPERRTSKTKEEKKALLENDDRLDIVELQKGSL